METKELCLEQIFKFKFITTYLNYKTYLLILNENAKDVIRNMLILRYVIHSSDIINWNNYTKTVIR